VYGQIALGVNIEVCCGLKSRFQGADGALLLRQGAGGYGSNDEPSASHQPLAGRVHRASAASAGAVADEAELVDRVCAPGALQGGPLAHWTHLTDERVPEVAIAIL
jgi:hypothetical protein